MARFRPLVKRLPPTRRLQWRKGKTLAMLANRRQWQREFDVIVSPAYEIEMEHISSSYLVIESSTSAKPNYIITE